MADSRLTFKLARWHARAPILKITQWLKSLYKLQAQKQHLPKQSSNQFQAQKQQLVEQSPMHEDQESKTNSNPYNLSHTCAICLNWICKARSRLLAVLQMHIAKQSTLSAAWQWFSLWHMSLISSISTSPLASMATSSPRSGTWSACGDKMLLFALSIPHFTICLWRNACAVHVLQQTSNC